MSPPRSVALLTAPYLLEEPCREPIEREECRRQLDALIPACATAGIELEPVPWDDPELPERAGSTYAACAIGSAWDYADRSEEFSTALERLSTRAPLFNSLETVRWNLSKTYLRDLAERGVPTVPTLWRDRASADSVRSGFDELGTDTLVIKPVVGQNAWRQVRLSRGEPLPSSEALPPGALMLQPFLDSIRTEGELSLVFIEGAFSHALRKLPAAGDYRIQATYGGREVAHAPSADELSVADTMLRALPEIVGELPLVARVDLVHGQDGALVVMELELIEPYLFPEFGPQLGARFAAALDSRIAGVGQGRI